MNLAPFFGWLLRASWQAAALTLIVLAVQWAAQRKLSARWRYALWLLVLARLALPVAPSSALSLFNFARWERLHALLQEESPNEAPPNAPLPIKVELPQFADAQPSEPQQTTIVAPASLPQQKYEATPAPPPRGIEHQLPLLPQPPPSPWRGFFEANWRLVAAWAWMVGVVCLGGLMLGQNFVFLRRLGAPRFMGDCAALDLLRSCREELGVKKKIRLAESPRVKSPAICGCFRPILLLPEGTLDRLSPAELRHIFLHEMAHLKQCDHFLIWLVMGAQVLHWFNPVLWFGFRRMALDRELSCDELALSRAGEGESRAYGQTILKLVELCSRRAAAPALMGIVEDSAQMTRRIKGIAAFKQRPAWSWLAAALLVVVGVVTLTDAQSGANLPTSRSASPARGLDTNPPPADEIIKAIQDKDLEKVQALLKEQPALISSTDRYGDGPVFHAALSDWKAGLELLLSNGADINSRTPIRMELIGYPEEETALHWAASVRKEPVDLLLSHGADVNAINRDWRTPLRTAVDSGNVEIAEILLSHGADPNLKDSLGESPMDAAIKAPSVKMENLLRAHGGVTARVRPAVDPSPRGLMAQVAGIAPAHWVRHDLQTNLASLTAADYAKLPTLLRTIFVGQTDEIESLLAKGADSNAAAKMPSPDPGGLYGVGELTPLGAAVVRGHVDAVKLLLAHHADVNALNLKGPFKAEGRTALQLAAILGRADIAAMLLASNADANIAGWGGDTPLHIAASLDESTIVKMLLEHGANPNTRQFGGVTPLQLAAESGHTEIVRLLLASKADANATNYEGWAPLRFALRSGNAQTAELLLGGKANPNLDLDAGWPALHWEARMGDEGMVRLLLAHGADPNGRNTNGDTPLLTAAHNTTNSAKIGQLLLANGANVDALDQDGQTPLFVAVATYKTELAKLLLADKADVNAKAIGERPDIGIEPQFVPTQFLEKNYGELKGATPLHVAALNGSKELVELLLAHRAQVNNTNDSGRTPLHLAALARRADLVELLFSSHADPNLKDNKGNTPLDLAVKNGDAAITSLLRQHGAIASPTNSSARPRSGLQPAEESNLRLASAAPMAAISGIPSASEISLSLASAVRSTTIDDILGPERPPEAFLVELDLARSVVVGTITAFNSDLAVTDDHYPLAVVDVTRTLKGEQKKTTMFSVFRQGDIPASELPPAYCPSHGIGDSGIWLIDDKGQNMCHNGFFGAEMLPEIQRALVVLAHRKWSAPANGLRACAAVVTLRLDPIPTFGDFIVVALQNVTSNNIVEPRFLDIEAVARADSGKATRITLESRASSGNISSDSLGPGETSYCGRFAAKGGFLFALTSIRPQSTNSILDPGHYTVAITVANQIREGRTGALPAAASVDPWTGKISVPPVEVEITAPEDRPRSGLQPATESNLRLASAAPTTASAAPQRGNAIPGSFIETLDLASSVVVGEITNIYPIPKALDGYRGRAVVRVTETLKGYREPTAAFPVVTNNRNLEFELPEHRVGDSGVWLIDSGGVNFGFNGYFGLGRLAEIQQDLDMLSRRKWSEPVSGLRAWAAAVTTDDEPISSRQPLLILALQNCAPTGLFVPNRLRVEVILTQDNGKCTTNVLENTAQLGQRARVLAPDEIHYCGDFSRRDLINCYVLAPPVGANSPFLAPGRYTVTMRVSNDIREGEATSASRAKSWTPSPPISNDIQEGGATYAPGIVVETWTGNLSTPPVQIEIPAPKNRRSSGLQSSAESNIRLASAAPTTASDASSGATPADQMFAAVRAGDLETIAKSLTANPQLVSAKNARGETALHVAVGLRLNKDMPRTATNRIEVAKLLLAHQAEVNARDNHGKTPLFRASEFDDEDLVALLLGNQADPNIADTNGTTPLHYAVSTSENKIVQLLLARPVNINATNHSGETPLRIASMYGEVEVGRLLLAKGASATFHDFAALGDLEKVKDLLKQNPGLALSKEADGSTPLMKAANRGWKDMVELLLANGADVNARATNAMTPLAWAALAGRRDVAQVLLAHHAEVNSQSAGNLTPLLFAAADSRDDGMVELLLASNANPNLSGADGKTALHLAAFENSEDMVKLLLAHGADPNLKDGDGHTALHWAAASSLGGVRGKGIAAQLAAHHADLNIRDKDGETPLFVALANRQYDVAALLIEQHADVNAKTVNYNPNFGTKLWLMAQAGQVGDSVTPEELKGASPLHAATARGDKNIVALLLGQHAEVNAAASDGHTPLHLAILHDSPGLVELLLANGADANIKDAAGVTPMGLAQNKGDPQLIELLRKHGGIAPPVDAPENAAAAAEWRQRSVIEENSHRVQIMKSAWPEASE